MQKVKSFFKSVEEGLAIPGSKILCYETTKPKSLGFEFEIYVW